MNHRTRSEQQDEGWRQATANLTELGRFGVLQIRHDRATQMAAALAFRTLFGLLPVLVVATVLVKALGMEEYYLEPLGRLFSFCGLDHVRIIPPSGSGLTSTITLNTWMQDRVRDAKQVNVAAIGWVGVAITIYAAISLMVTIENCFNLIYRVPHGRAWTNRVPIYWFVLTLSPLLLIFSTFVDSRFQDLMSRFSLQGPLSTLIGALWTLFAMWLLMFSTYMLFPNTRVRARPAMAGALVSATLLEIGKRTMGIYLQNAMSISQLYGSLGLIPLFMFWIYLMWLAALFGLEVSAVLQRHARGWPFGHSGDQELPGDSDLVTLIVRQLGDTFNLPKQMPPASSAQCSESHRVHELPHTIPLRRTTSAPATATLFQRWQEAGKCETRQSAEK